MTVLMVMVVFQTARFHYRRILTEKAFKMQHQTQCFILTLVRKSQLDVGETNQTSPEEPKHSSIN